MVDRVSVSPHFYVDEFDQPARHGFSHVPYPVDQATPDGSTWLEARLRPLCELLEAVRSYMGDKPITVISGYRTAAYNNRVGGVAYSRHEQGDASDIIIEGLEPDVVHEGIWRLYENDGIPRLGGLGLYRSWYDSKTGEVHEGFVHIDIRPNQGHVARWEGQRSRKQTEGLA